jgi:hypothetical protein
MAKLSMIPKEALIQRIGSAYASAARSIGSILRGLDPGSYTAIAGGVALKRIRDIIIQLDYRAAAWSKSSIKAAYQESRVMAETRLEAIGAKRPKPKRGSKPPAGPDRHGKAVAKYANKTISDYLDANRTILTTAGKYLSILAHARKKLDQVRDAELEAFSSAEVKQMINRTVAGSLRARTRYNEGEAHLTRKDISAKIKEKLLGKIDGQDFITINGRNYNLKSYSELVARTRMRESQTEAVIKMSEEFGTDLVEIPRHDSPCEICSEHQGQVFSISGKHSDYPQLPDGGPPFHPNCECTTNPTTELALSWRGR